MLKDKNEYIPEKSVFNSLGLPVLMDYCKNEVTGLGHEGGPVLLPGFAIIW